MKEILVLCSTNVVRSPLFAALLNQRAHEVGSAWVFTARGTLCGATPRGADRRIQKLARNRGVSLNEHTSAGVTLSELDTASLVLCCDEDSYWSVRRDFASVPHAKVRMITEFGKDLGLKEIAEPLTGEISFEAVAETADILVPMVIEKLPQYV